MAGARRHGRWRHWPTATPISKVYRCRERRLKYGPYATHNYIIRHVFGEILWLAFESWALCVLTRKTGVVAFSWFATTLWPYCRVWWLVSISILRTATVKCDVNSKLWQWHFVFFTFWLLRHFFLFSVVIISGLAFCQLCWVRSTSVLFSAVLFKKMFLYPVISAIQSKI